MNSDDIRRILSNDEACAPHFEGVFARDEFIERLLSLSFNVDNRLLLYVFNTHASSQPGEHWIAVASRGRRASSFDSCGLHPARLPDVARALAYRHDIVHWNATPLQNITTTACADYCIIFALTTARRWSFDRLLNAFPSTSSLQRDHIVRNTIVSLYGTSALSTIRASDPDLSGTHNLHINDVVNLTETLGLYDRSDFYCMN